MRITLSGIDKALQNMQGDIKKEVERIAEAVYKAARANTPVRTGKAKAGWQKQTSKDDFAVTNDVSYVKYLEKPYTKSKQAPNGIIGPTLTQVKGRLK